MKHYIDQLNKIIFNLDKRKNKNIGHAKLRELLSNLIEEMGYKPKVIYTLKDLGPALNSGFIGERRYGIYKNGVFVEDYFDKKSATANLYKYRRGWRWPLSIKKEKQLRSGIPLKLQGKENAQRRRIL